MQSFSGEGKCLVREHKVSAQIVRELKNRFSFSMSAIVLQEKANVLQEYAKFQWGTQYF